jgi:hypothetical protein
MFNRVQTFLGRAFVLDLEDIKREEGQNAVLSS